MKSVLKWITIFFLSAIVFVSFLLVEAVILTLAHQFKPLFLYFSLIPAFILAIFFRKHIKKDINTIPNLTIPVLLLIFLISLLLVFYPHDIFGGQDEAVYSNYAIHLTRNGSLNFFPYLNNLPNDFVKNAKIMPPAYIVYLATQQVFFGVQGLLRGNVIIIILGLISFFLISSYLGGNKVGLIATILFSSSMPFLWFSRETMSENLSFFLLWSLILFFFLTLKSKRLIYIIVVIICSWLFALTRLEGFLLQFLLLLIIPSTLFLLKSTRKKNILYITFFFFLIVVSNVIIARTTSVSLLIRMIPSVNYSLKRDITALFPKAIIQNIDDSTVLIKKARVTNLYDKMTVFFALMLAKYNFFLVISSIFLVTSQFFIQRKKHIKIKFYYFFILIILIPEFYKFTSPGVTIGIPWLYRRYMYALLPFSYLSLSLLLINKLKNKKMLVINFTIFLIINVILSKNIIFLKNNWLLVNRLNEITKDISRKDLILIKETPLRDYYPNSFLIMNKEVRSSPTSILWLQHFFPEKKLFNGVFYNKIFLLSADNKDINSSFDIVSSKFVDVLVHSSFNIVSRKSVDVQYSQLVSSCQLHLLGAEEGLTDPYNIGVLPFSDVVKYCSEQGNEVEHHKETLYLYELVYDKI